jgi:ATP-dependent DNA ligase
MLWNLHGMVLNMWASISQRNQWLEANLFTADLNNSHIIKHVITLKVDTLEQLNTIYEGFLAANYEGQMVRVDDVYETKRSKFLLKRKEFQDKEYQILEVGEGTGNRTGMAGFMVMKNEDGTIFKSNIKGSHEFLTELLQNKQEIVGQLATVQFFHLTPDGVPRFPYITAIRNYE